MREHSVLDIVWDWLSARGYDGLACVEEGCGCGLDDLAPCDEFGDHCVAAYRHECADCDLTGPRTTGCWLPEGI